MSKLCLSLTGLVVAIAATAFAEGDSTNSSNSPQGLEGAWELVAEVVDGELQENPPTTLVVTGEIWLTKGRMDDHYPGIRDQVPIPGLKLRGEGFVVKQKVHYRADLAPNTFEYRPGGSMETDEGDPIPSSFGQRKRHSLFRIRGNFLEICERREPVEGQSAWPPGFVSTPDTNLTLRVYRRIQEGKAEVKRQDAVEQKSPLKVDEPQIEKIKIENANITVKGRRVTIQGGTVILNLK